MLIRFLTPLTGVLLMLPFAGCSDSTAKQNAKGPDSKSTIHAACTTGMVADLVRQIGGSHVNVLQIMKAGVDPHLYKASPGDIDSLDKADVIFYSGHHLEGKMADLLAKQGEKKRAVAIAEAVTQSDLLKTEEGVVDPHLWFDVSLWQQAARKVCDTLIEADPSHAETYRQQWQKHDADLAGLHQHVKQHLATIDEKQRVLVTAHDAFRYFSKAYGIEVKSIQGISTESEASVKQVNDLVDYLVKRQIKAVFVESSVPEKNIKALVEGCAARGHPVKIGGELYSDALGPQGSHAATYIGMVKQNVQTIIQALK